MELVGCQSAELVIVDSSTIYDLNKIYRQKDALTDVLSFPLEAEFSGGLIGSVAICADVAKIQAQENKNTFEEELQILFLHGLLHLLGFDHETDNGEMAKKEEFLRQKLNLKTGLIKRSDG